MKGVILGKEAMHDVSAGPAGPLEGLRIFHEIFLRPSRDRKRRALTDSVIPIAHSAAL
jgi:hypothetical protein